MRPFKNARRVNSPGSADRAPAASLLFPFVTFDYETPYGGETTLISITNLSLLKTGKVKGIRFSTLDAICRELDCQPGEILEYLPEYV